MACQAPPWMLGGAVVGEVVEWPRGRDGPPVREGNTSGDPAERLACPFENDERAPAQRGTAGSATVSAGCRPGSASHGKTVRPSQDSLDGQRGRSQIVSSGLRRLTPPQRFMYDYGCFVSFWGNFDLMMEALVWHLRNTDPITNCREINTLTSGAKHERLTELLKDVSPEAMLALHRVFSVAERNDWIHGVVLNPRGDFSVLTRFRVRKSPLKVENTPIDFGGPFQEFYEAYGLFTEAVDRLLGIDARAVCDEYLGAVQRQV